MLQGDNQKPSGSHSLIERPPEGLLLPCSNQFPLTANSVFFASFG